MKEVIEMKEKNILADAVRLFDKYIKNTGISWDGGKNFAQVTGIERGTGFSIEDFSKEQIKIYAKGKIYAENGLLSFVNINIKIFADGNVRVVMDDSKMMLNIRKWLAFDEFAEKIKSENKPFRTEKRAA